MNNQTFLSAVKLACLFVLSLTANTALSQSIAITNAEVYTVASQGILSRATVVFSDGKITAIYDGDSVPATIDADKVIDAKGRILTPGFIASNNKLGLVEVGAVSLSRDDGDKKADISFDTSLAFNPKSSLIPYARKGGITSAIVMPSGGEDMFKGQSFAVNLSGRFDSVIARQNAVLIKLGAKSKSSRAFTLQKLTYTLEDAQKKLTKLNTDKEKDKAKPPKRDELIINEILMGKKPLLAHVERATDILALLILKQKYSLNLVLIGAQDAVLVKDEIAKANVPVLVNTLNNLPNSFDSLHSSLTNVSTLHQAGVKIIISNSGESHNINQLRFDAGIAVANGLSKTQAVAAVTANVADVFNLNSGRIAVGKDANLVLWSSDPFEISTKVDSMWINGQEVSTKSRQDALRNRYMSKRDMPRAYSR